MKQFFIASILLIAGIIYVNFLSSVHAVALLRPLSEFPQQLGEFTMVSEQSFSDEVMGSLGVDQYIMREYRDKDGYPLWLYVGFYESQAEGEIIHSPKHCMPGSGWNALQTDKISLPDPLNAKSSFIVNQMVLQKGLDRQLAYYWYQSRGRVVADEYWDRAYMIFDSVVKRRSDGALVRITGPGGNLPDDIKKQQQFAIELLQNLSLYLPE
jgi:EpsI family protein